MESPELYLMAFLASFMYCAAKSLQQLNVQNKLYYFIVPVSLIMCCLEVWSVTVISKHGFGWLILFLGTGAGLGSIAATYLHDKFITKEDI